MSDGEVEIDISTSVKRPEVSDPWGFKAGNYTVDEKGVINPGKRPIGAEDGNNSIMPAPTAEKGMNLEVYFDENGKIRVKDAEKRDPIWAGNPEELTAAQTDMAKKEVGKLPFEDDPIFVVPSQPEDEGRALRGEYLRDAEVALAQAQREVAIDDRSDELLKRGIVEWFNSEEADRGQRVRVAEDIAYAEEQIEAEKGDFNKEKIHNKLAEAGLADSPEDLKEVDEKADRQGELISKFKTGDLTQEEGEELADLIKFHADNAAKDRRRTEYYGQDTVLDIADVVMPGGPLFGNLPVGETREVLDIYKKARKVRDLQQVAQLRTGYDAEAHNRDVDYMNALVVQAGGPDNLAAFMNAQSLESKDLIADRLNHVQIEHILAVYANQEVLSRYETPEGYMRKAEVKRLFDLAALAKLNKEAGDARRENMQIAARRGLRNAKRVAQNLFDLTGAAVLNSRWDVRQYAGEDIRRLQENVRRRNEAFAQGNDSTKRQDARYERNNEVLRLLNNPDVRTRYANAIQVDHVEAYAAKAGKDRAGIRSEMDKSVRDQEKARQNKELARQDKERIKLERQSQKEARAIAVEAEKERASQELKNAAKEKALELKNRGLRFLGDVCQMYLWAFLHGATNGLITHNQVFGAVEWAVWKGPDAAENFKKGAKKKLNWLQRMFGMSDEEEEQNVATPTQPARTAPTQGYYGGAPLQPTI